MPTDLPYAAEAESSLSYDELEVSVSKLMINKPTETSFRTAHQSDGDVKHANELI